MKMAEVADAPVILVADIDRGGVFASILGTLDLLEPHESARVCGIIINKFRGDISILEPGIKMIEARTGKPVLGVLPYAAEIQVEQEDSLGIGSRPGARGKALVDIAVVRLPRISNFTDFDALSSLPGVGVRYVSERAGLGAPDILILPGTKQTIPDLQWLKDTGLAEEIVSAARQGTAVVGICGGYQMLGRTVSDPDHAESDADTTDGLGLLGIVTVFRAAKTTHQVTGVTLESRFFEAGQTIQGYEIHMGESTLGKEAACLFEITSRSDRPTDIREGCASPTLNVFGTYVHGIFDNDAIRFGLVNRICRKKGVPEMRPTSASSFAADKERRYRDLARTIAARLRMKVIYDAMKLDSGAGCQSR
jgi:adenosylcobyric acid synthase